MLRLMCAGFAIIVGYCAWQWLKFLMDNATQLQAAFAGLPS